MDHQRSDNLPAQGVVVVVVVVVEIRVVCGQWIKREKHSSRKAKRGIQAHPKFEVVGWQWKRKWGGREGPRLGACEAGIASLSLPES